MRKTLKVIKYRYDENMSQQKIANALNISRGVVRDYLSRFNATGLSWLDVKELSDRELELLLFSKVDTVKLECPDWAYIHTEMKKKGATLAVLHEEYIAYKPSGIGYPHFCRQYKKFTKRLPASARLTHQAGEKVMVDYCGPTVNITNPKAGEIKTAQIFVGVLGASNYIYADAFIYTKYSS